jgi:two-component system, cell cycle sensor histidine kinase and response regulator CckA
MDAYDYQKIRQLFDDYLRMYASRDDRLTKHFSDDFSGFTGGGDSLVKDKEEWVAITRQDFAQVKDPLRIDLKDLSIQLLSDTVAITTGFFTIHLPIKDHILSRETARLVLVFHKEIEGWKISHSSISIPYHLVREGEIYPLQELVERNRFLEEQVANRTSQLSEANDKLQATNENLLREIEDRKKAEEALKESEYFFRESQRSASIGSYKADFVAGYWESSEVMDTIFGIGQDYDRSIQGWLEIVHPEDREMMAHYLKEEVIAKRKPFSKEYRIIRKNDGETRWVNGTGTVHFDNNGKVLSLFGTILDITERKLTEDKLQKKNAENEQFIYTVSHDLRSPLVTVKTFMGYLEKDLEDGNQEHLVQDIKFIHNAADKMKLLLDELLELSRIDRIEAPPVNVSLMEVLTESLGALAGIISERKVEITLPSMDLILFGDQQRLCQIWQNLIENAIKYCPDGNIPRVAIGVQQANGTTVFSVKDNGIGIDPQYHNKVFGIFEKLDPKSPGAGLGLSMIQRIVMKCGGRIWIESQGANKGSCFYFTLPHAVNQNPLQV